LLAAFAVSIPAACQEPSGAQLKALLQRLEAKVEQLTSQVESQRADIERLRAALNCGLRNADCGFQTTPTMDPQSAVQSAGNPKSEFRDPQSGNPQSEIRQTVAGIQFSGDFRLRFDAALRSSNQFAGPLQNVRGRYRLRLNADRSLDRRFDVHLQLATGALNNPLTNDQDMAGMNAKHPFSVAEAWGDFHPHKNFSMRGGRMPEVFRRRTRFIWDDDVRFNGFQQIARLPLADGPLGLKSVEFRAGEYLLSNPNIAVLPASSPLVAAGFQPGKKVRDAALFHPGFFAEGSLGGRWKHEVISDVQLFRNPNQIQLASLASGFPVLINPALGVSLSGPINELGSATCTPDRARYYAPHYQIVHLGYRLQHDGWMLHGREVPAWLDVRLARNVGAGKLRDAVLVGASVGEIRRAGDVRFLYEYFIKDANSLLPQFTDDDVGTGSGVNIAVHGIRFDLGLARFLQWENLLFVQHQRRGSNPAENLFVPLPRGANPTFRFLSQLNFTF
jgi:hypothetical protein